MKFLCQSVQKWAVNMHGVAFSRSPHFAGVEKNIRGPPSGLHGLRERAIMLYAFALLACLLYASLRRPWAQHIGAGGAKSRVSGVFPGNRRLPRVGRPSDKSVHGCI